MEIRKFKKIFVIVFVFLLIPTQILGADYWTGNNYYNSNEGAPWGVTQDKILKVTSPGRAYKVKDVNVYSAHITDNAKDIGKPIENAFFWINKSRLAYVKLFKVTGGQDISFLFDKSIYLYCAEFDSSFVLINDGRWGTDGTRYTLQDNTAWIMIVFRKVNGDLSDASGLDQDISSQDIEAYEQRYVLFEPFVYTLNMNGGTYMGSTATRTIERLGVEKITLPTPSKAGYTFNGWKTGSGAVYKGTLPNTFDSNLFKDTTLTASFSEILPVKVTLNREYAIMEQNSDERITIKATVTPSNAYNKSVTYKSSNENVATVDNSGKITPKNTGVATITATTFNGKTASCEVYVMGFEVTVPTYCTLNESYEIKINVYNNGKSGMSGRKHVLLDSDDTVNLIRVGDASTEYAAFSESKTDYNGIFQRHTREYFADIVESQKVYYRLIVDEELKKAGDYEGNVTFTVTVI